MFNKTLKPGSKKRLNVDVATGQPVLTFHDLVLATTDAQERFKSRLTRAGHWTRQLVQCLLKYGKGIDVFIQQQPDITAVVWGTVRFLIVVGSNAEMSAEFLFAWN